MPPQQYLWVIPRGFPQVHMPEYAFMVEQTACGPCGKPPAEFDRHILEDGCPGKLTAKQDVIGDKVRELPTNSDGEPNL